MASQQTDKGFADSLASAVEADDGGHENKRRPPELSAATYRLFAAIDLEQGDTVHAALHLSRVADAREAGLPLHPAGVLNEEGRWDYTEAAAALPQTGRFDSATGQGERTFIPYNATRERPTSDDRAPTEQLAGAAPSTAPTVDRLRGNLTTLGESTRTNRALLVDLRTGIEDLLDT